MLKKILSLRHSLVSKLIFTVGLTLLITIPTWAFFNIRYQEKRLMHNIMVSTDRLTNTIKLGTRYAMMLNSRDDINEIINNIGRQKEIESIRIYNKAGQIKFANHPAEVDRITNIKAEACDICHHSAPPRSSLSLEQRTRIFKSPAGYRLLGIISPIRNEPGCSTAACHEHPRDKQILGALDVVVSLQNTDKEIRDAEMGIFVLAGILLLVTSGIISVFVFRFFNRPIRKLIESTQRIARGVYPSSVEVSGDDEMGQLAAAINQMSRQIKAKQAQVNKQRDEYQALFEQVPCLITVQDTDYRLLQYNREFARRFDPRPQDYCYHAYKGRDEKCVNCPVEKTFADGQTHFAEEMGLNKDGTPTHWVVRTSPVKNSNGDIVAAMEMSLDITELKMLQEQLKKSEKKYHDIFNNIPNPVFVLDADTLEIIDCNRSVQTVYGYDRNEICQQSFLDLMDGENRPAAAARIKKSTMLNQVRHINRAGDVIYVDIWISPSVYPGREVLLVTTSDITQRLETEQQLIQASKMATLGEMATGVAHELNQPLSVIKTASSFFLKKLDQKQPLDHEVLVKMLGKIDANVDRATKIINHMRQFARKSDLQLEKVQVNAVLESAFEIFSQQLKLRAIEVAWELDENLPKIKADPGRLEQVFINLLLNARDAIEEKWGPPPAQPGDKKITLKTKLDGRRVVCEVCDTGPGIPAALADKIFEPFYTTKEVGKGTGLGLSISYGIIKDCGGGIQVTANKPQGACFVLEFPVPEREDEKNDISGR